MPSASAHKKLADFLDENGYRFAYSFIATLVNHSDRTIEKYIAPNGAPVIIEVWNDGTAFEVYGALDNTNSVPDTLTALGTYGAR